MAHCLSKEERAREGEARAREALSSGSEQCGHPQEWMDVPGMVNLVLRFVKLCGLVLCLLLLQLNSTRITCSNWPVCELGKIVPRPSVVLLGCEESSLLEQQ